MVSASGKRITWLELPETVRTRIERIIGGGPVVTAVSQPGGFSPGSADRVVTESGRRAFVKAVTPAVNARSAELARDEMRITAMLPERVPAPRLIDGFDDGDWVVLVLEDVAGTHPRTPWVASEIDAAVTALAELDQALTPAPAGLKNAGDLFAEDFAGWDRVAADPPAGLDPWESDHLPELRAAAERTVARLRTGDTVAHCDIRADNMIVRPDGRVIIVDWPWAAVAPRWWNRVDLAANVWVHGGDPERVIEGIDRRIVTDAFAALAGMFRDVCRQPPPPGIPTVRAFQRWQADELQRWLKAEM
ncbi:aminoglycoside phosphotransferase family protein [Actinoplanes sp. NPDC048796]|uniref:aminoglycoside phosphotransferase family protein n=1 Tax=unclassified Actinoplanes TaxID=2626549 RepID=UPI003407C0AA